MGSVALRAPIAPALAQIGLLALIAWAPWPYGSVEPRSRLVLQIALGGLVLLWTIDSAVRGRAAPWFPAAGLVIALGVALGLAQTLPLPPRLLSAIAPGTARWRHALLPQAFETPAGDATAASGSPGNPTPPFPPFARVGQGGYPAELTQYPAELTHDPAATATAYAPASISLYPAATRSVALELAMYLAAFLVAAWSLSTRAAQQRLLVVAALTGGAVSFVGIAQRLTAKAMLAWGITAGDATAFGPFVNRNNAGGFLNLCLAGCIGLLFALAQRSRHGSGRTATRPDPAPGGAEYPHGVHGSSPYSQARPDPAAEDSPYSPPGGGAEADPYRRRHGRRHAVGVTAWAQRHATAWSTRDLAVLALGALIVAGVCCTLSRGAVIATAGSAAIVALVALVTRGPSAVSYRALGLAGAAIALVFWVGMAGVLRDRLATLNDVNASGGRVPHWREALRSARDFGLWGGGLGTYRFVYPMYQTQPDDGVFYHAENQYIESFVESGAAGFLLLVAAIVLVVAAAWRLAHDRTAEPTGALALGTLFAVSTQAIQGFVDFGLYIPSNALLLAVLCGSAAGGALRARRSSFFPVGTRSRLWPCLTTGALTCLAFAHGAELREAAAADPFIWRARGELDGPGRGTAAALDRAVAQLEQAVRHVPWDAELELELSEACIDRYQREARAELRDDPDAAELADVLVTQLSDPLALAAASRRLREDGKDPAEWLAELPAVQKNLRPAVEHLLRARAACPLLPRVHLHLAELSFLLGPVDDGAAHLDRAERLAPADPDLWFDAGSTDWALGRTAAACAAWRRSLELSARHETEIFDRAFENMAARDAALEIAGNLPDTLVRIARGRRGGRLSDADETALLARARGVLEQGGSAALAPWHRLEAVVCAELGEPDAAIAAYRRAIGLEPEQVTWRYELAVLLCDRGRLAEALTEARWCARRDQSRSDVRGLLAEISEKLLRGEPAGASEL